MYHLPDGSLRQKHYLMLLFSGAPLEVLLYDDSITSFLVIPPSIGQWDNDLYSMTVFLEYT